MFLKDLIKLIQRAMNAAGSKLTEDGEYGPVSAAEAGKYSFQIVAKPKQLVGVDPSGKPNTTPAGAVENPAYIEAKKFDGKSERDAGFVGYLSRFWTKLGLNYKTIIGSSFAWCGLFIFAMNTNVGQKAIGGAAGARNWAKYGVEVEWKKNGIPRGAVMHLNHAGDCSSGKNNHVTFADGDCAPQDLIEMVKGADGVYRMGSKLLTGATVPGFGGNQGDTVKRSIYAASEVCEVRWPSELALPPPITKSVNCAGKGGPESTR